MAALSEQSVFTSIESYDKGTCVKRQIFECSEKLRVLQDETADLAIDQHLSSIMLHASNLDCYLL